MKTIIGYRGQLDADWDWRLPERPPAAPGLLPVVARPWPAARRLVSTLRPRWPASPRRLLPGAGIALPAALLLSVASVVGSSDAGRPGQAALSAASPPGSTSAGTPDSASVLNVTSAETTQYISSNSLPPVVPPQSAAGARIVEGISARGGLVFIGFFLVILILASEVWFVRNSEPRRRLSEAPDD